MDEEHGMKFVPPRVAASPRAMAALEQSGTVLNHYLSRHLRGDWGEVDQETKHGNDRILADLGGLISIFPIAPGAVLCLVTKVGPTSTSALLVDEVTEVCNVQ